MSICIQLHDRYEIKTHANNDYNRFRKSFCLDCITSNAFYSPDAKGLGIYYAFLLFLLFSMGILDIAEPTIGPDP